MAQYDAFINLQISKKGQTALDKLEGQINRITGRNQTGAGRTRGAGGGRGSTTAEVKLEANRKRQADRTIATKKVTRRLGDQIQRLNEAGFKTDKLRARLREAGRNADKGKIEAARADNKILKDDITLLQKKLKAEKAIVKQRQLANPLNLKNRQQGIRAGFQSRIDLLEAKGRNVGPLRKQMGQITDAANRPAFRNPFSGDVIKGAVQPGTLQRENDLMDRLIKKEEFKLKIDREQAKQTERELKANQKIVEKLKGATGFKASEYGPQLPGVPQYLPTAPTGEYSNIASGRSFDTQGNRTRLNNPITQFMGKRFGAKKGFDVQSAMISGAFPLLFGQGPVTAAAGALGGGVGGMFGQMGGFAGGLAATAAVSAIQQSIAGIGKLGQALNPFTADIGQLTKSLGLAGTAEGQRLKLIETLSGKQAALAEATRVLSRQVGEAGAKSIKVFGEKMQGVGNELNKVMTKLGAAVAQLINETGLLDLLEGILKFINGIDGQKLKGFTQIMLAMSGKANYGQLASGIKNMTSKVDSANTLNSSGEGSSSSINSLFKGQFKSASEEVDFLRDSIKLGSEQAEIKKKVFEFNEKIKEVTKDISKEEKLALFDNEQKLTKQLEEINLLKRQAELYENIRSTIADGMVNAVEALIDRTKSLNEVLASVVKQIARAFLTAGINALVGNISFGGPANNIQPGPKLDRVFGNPGPRTAPIIPRATGGYVTKPEVSLIAEAGEDEYIIPSSKMQGAMQRYSAGARGQAVIPGSGTVASGSGVPGGSVQIDYTGPVLNFNSEEFVPRSAIPEIVNSAARKGASAGSAQVFSQMRNSRSTRSRMAL